MSIAPSHLIPALVTSFLAWRVYRRVRRNIGRQPMQPRRMRLRIVFFGLLSVLLAGVALVTPITLTGLASGFILGVLLAVIGVRHTRFEVTPEGRFYTPNSYIGGVISVLLVGRLVYRLLALYGDPHALGLPEHGIFKSPLTFLMFGLLAGYYIAYYIGLFLRYRRMK
jgi:hypothetical protein